MRQFDSHFISIHCGPWLNFGHNLKPLSLKLWPAQSPTDNDNDHNDNIHDDNQNDIADIDVHMPTHKGHHWQTNHVIGHHRIFMNSYNIWPNVPNSFTNWSDLKHQKQTNQDYISSFRQIVQNPSSYFDDSMCVAPPGVVLVVMFLWLSTAVSPPPYSTARTSMCIVSILFPMNEALNSSTPDEKNCV